MFFRNSKCLKYPVDTLLDKYVKDIIAQKYGQKINPPHIRSKWPNIENWKNKNCSIIRNIQWMIGLEHYVKVGRKYIERYKNLDTAEWPHLLWFKTSDSIHNEHKEIAITNSA